MLTLLFIVLMWLPAPSFCSELVLGIDTAYVYDSNFYKSSTEEISAQSLVVGGNIRLEEKEGRFRYLAEYAGSYEFFKEQDEADAPQHRLRLNGSYDINTLTTFSLNNIYRDIRNLRFSQEDISNGDSGVVPNNDRYQRNDLELKLHRDISRSWELEINAAYRFIDFERNVNRSDSDSIEAGGWLFYRFAPQHRFGGGVSVVSQDYDGAEFRLDSEADYLITDVAWIYDMGENLQLTVNGGPVWYRTEQTVTDYVQQTQFVGAGQDDLVFRSNVFSCDFDSATSTGIASRCDFDTPGAEPIPANDLGGVQNFPLQVGPEVGEDDDMTFFGGASLAGSFSDWNTDVELRHSQSVTTGDAIPASLTKFRWELGYAPARANWDAYVAGSWERREALSDSTTLDYIVIPGQEDAAQRSFAFTKVRDPDDRRDAFTAVVGIRSYFTRAFSGSVGVRFRHTESEVSGRETDDDSYYVVVRLSYTFDAIRF
ncbi:MAG: hypothetical protein V7746_00880 [Halioglobus sp.]